MPTLNWIGKEAVVNHDKEVPFRLLKKVKAHSVGDSQNLIIKGDNLEGLKALMPYYIGKVKCIYIDPPYNTGNENWVYNDKVNSPKIKKWLEASLKGHSVDANDLCRHDKWLCMMYPRLKLLRDLLSEDGVILISCDDNEYQNLRLIMDEIFTESNFIGHFIWKKKGGASNTEKILGVITEYIMIYSKNKQNIKFNQREIDKDYKLKDDDGFYNLIQPVKTNKGGYERKTMRYGIKNPETSEIVYPPEGKRWTIGEKTALELLEQSLIVFQKDKDGKTLVYLKEYSTETGSNGIFLNLLISKGSLKSAKNELERLGFDRELFDTPKPSILVKHLLEVISLPEDIILDSFAGSGTTGHAVLDLNKEDGGKRKFILIEMEDDIAKKITAERIKRAIEKYNYKDGFEYCELDKSLFDENGQIEETCEFNQFATYIYFTETQTNIDKKQIDKNFIGESGETEYYLIYKEKMKNVLDKGFLKKIKKTKNKKVIYADFCMVDDDTLEKFNIQFKQIPYEVKVY